MTLASQFRGDIQAETLSQETAQPLPDVKKPSLASQFAGAGLADTVGRNLGAAQQTTPDQSLKVARLADQTGLPIDAVQRNYDQILADIKNRETDPLEIARNNPSLAKWLAKPDNAAVATNDIGILKRLERLIPGEQAFIGLLDPFRQAGSEAVRLPGTVLAGTASALEAATRTADRFTGGSLSSVDQFLQQHVGRPPDWADPSVGLRTVGEPIKDLAGQAAVPEERQNIATDIGGAIGQLGVQVAQAIFAPPTLVPSLLAQGADIQAERAQAAGTAGTAESDAAILAGAGVTAILEKVGIGQLLNRMPPQVKNAILKKATDIAVAGGIEAAQELVENIAQNVITQQLTNPGQQIVDQDTWREITAAGGAGAFLRAVIQAATKGRDRQKAAAEQATIDAIVAAGDETWLKQNSPEQLQEFIAGAKQAGFDTVYVPTEQAATYFQTAGLDMEQVLSAAGVDRQEILAAQATGGDIAIPLEIYSVALSEHHQSGLREFARLRPETPTPAEGGDAEAIRQESDAIMRRFIDSVQEPAGKVKEDVVGQLVAIGQDRDTAEAYGTLLDKAFTALGQRSGIDGFDLYSRYRLNITRENFGRQPIDVSIDPYLDAIRSGEFPADPVFRRRAEQVSNELERAGVSPQESNESIRRALQESQASTITLNQYTPDEVEFFRSMGIPVGPSRETQPRSELPATGDRTITGRPPREGWAEATVVTGTDGRPATIYRGSRDGTTSPGDFEQLSAATGHPSSALGVWFSADRADAARYGAVGEYNLDIRNPKAYSTDDAPAFDTPEQYAALRQELEAAGHDGIVFDFRDVGGPVQMVAFGPGSVISKERALLQQPGEGVKRGQIKIGKGGFEISLFEKADLSTFIHESGHFFFEVMGDLSSSPDAPQQIKDDYETALKWLGVESRDQIGVEQHEKWARGFESYLGEGKAPDPELRTLFSRFRTWMIAIYKSLRNLNVELTGEVRGVFDRMIASDEEIAAANNQIQTGEFQTKEEAGMTDKQWGAYQKLLVESRAEAEETLTARAYGEVKREREAWWKERLKEVAAEVEAEANQMPVYQAWSFLADNQSPDGSPYTGALEHAKLDKSVLLSMYDQEFLNKNLRYKGVYQAEGGYHPSLIAEQFGFDSGQAVIERLASAPKKSDWVANESRRRMLEQYGDMRNDGTLPEQAMKAAHNERRFKAIEAELTALGRIIGRAPPKVAELRRLADNMIASKKARDIQPYLYLRAERKAAKDYAELATKGQRAQAYEAKQRQLLNGLLYDRAWKAKEEVENIREYANGLMKKSKQEKLAKAGGSYLQQINDILSAYQFRKLPLKQIDRLESLRAWVEKMQEEGDITAVPDEVIRRVEGQSVNYMNVSLEELRGVRDSLRNIDHLSNLKNKLLKKGEQRDKEEARAEMLSRLEQSYKDGKPLAPSDFPRNVAERMGNTLQSLADALWRPETIIEAMDGGESGPWHDYLWEPANEARAIQNELREKVGKPLEELASKLDRKWQNSLHDPFEVAGRQMKRYEIIGMALNLGNDGNRQKLMQGGYWRGDAHIPYTNADIETAISYLTSQDWEMIQSVWDTINSLWPDIVAQQQRLSGLPPEKVEAVPFVVNAADGKTMTMRGGYFPVAYDPRQSGAGEKQAADAAQALLSGQYTRAATPKGHLKERTDYSAPIMLDYQAVLTRHIDDVITDLSHREFLKQAQWIVSDTKTKVALQERIGESGYKALRAFIGHTVGADRPITDASTKAWHRVSDTVLANTAVYALGFRVITAWGNIPAGMVQAMARVKPKYVIRGFKEFYERHGEASAIVHELSPFMRHKARDIDASYSEVMAKLGGKNSTRRMIARASMQVHRVADYIVSHGVWYGRYLQAIDQNESVEAATALADKAVRQTQTAGAPKDLSGVERDPLFKMFRMFIGPMLIMNNRIRESVTRRGIIETWPEAFGTLIAAWFLPALIFELAVGRGPEDEEDPESWYLWAATKTGMYPLQTIPMVRDVAAIIEAKALDQYRQVRAAPIAEAGAAVVKAFDVIASQISDAEEIDDLDAGKISKATFKAIGPLFGLPTNQIDVTGSFMYDVMTGEYEPDSPLDYRYLLMRRPKEEQ